MEDNKSIFFDLKESELIFLFSLASAALYFNCIAYFQQYFKVLGFSQFFLHLPLEFYIVNGQIPIAFTTIICLLVFNGIYTKFSGRFTAAISNCPILILALLSSYDLIAFWQTNVIISTYSVVFTISCYIFYLLLFFANINLVKYLWEFESFGKICLIILLISSTAVSSQIIGEWEGNQVHDGTSTNNFEIQFKFTNNSSDSIKNEHFSLIFYENGNYYTIMTNQTAKGLSKIYIFPENEIEYAIVNKTN